jgi:hypothetical protein
MVAQHSVRPVPVPSPARLIAPSVSLGRPIGESVVSEGEDGAFEVVQQRGSGLVIGASACRNVSGRQDDLRSECQRWLQGRTIGAATRQQRHAGSRPP